MITPLKERTFWERLPRLTISFGNREIASWRLLAGLGLICGQLALLLLLTTEGITWGPSLVLIGANLLSFALLIELAKRLFGYWRLVLLEHVSLALLTTGLAAHWLSLPVLTVLDHWSVAMALGLAFGRFGCFLGGCCYGRPAKFGVRYPWRFGYTLPPAVRQARRIPVQAYESMGLVAIFCIGATATIASHQPGTPFVLFLTLYGVMRFFLEFLRGDKRPYWLFLSEAQWNSLGFILLAMILKFS